MRDLHLLAVRLVVTVAKLARPGGVRSVVAESLLLKHQVIISRRSRRRTPAPNHVRSIRTRIDDAVRASPASRETCRDSQAGDIVTIPQGAG